jgi:RHH-type rel operon transcriptional repressor/antitoxin RelB
VVKTLMLRIRLGKVLETRIAKLAVTHGGTKSAVVRKAVLRYLEDQEDIALARRAKKSSGREKSIADLRKALCLDC